MMITRYFLISAGLCDSLGLVQYRKRTADGSFVVSSYDLLAYGIEKAIEEGAKPITKEQIDLLNIK
jgi:hypothetical protein